MDATERDLRRDLVARLRELNARGLSEGTSGNISVRHGARMLISPSATPYDTLEPEMIASVDLADPAGGYVGPLKPSTEWRFHHALLRERPEAQAVVHAHPPHCTALAIARREIPACHYMIAAFGGPNVRCAGYATFGTQALSDLAVEALRERTACLLANHGMIAIGDSLARAMWRAVELETLARQYILSLAVGNPVILDDAAIAEAMDLFAGYGNPQKESSGSR